MQIFTSLLVILPFVVAVGCAAAESATSPAPAGLEGKITIHPVEGVWTAHIELTNGTNGPLASGRYERFSVTRTDVSPAVTVAASPAHAMSPHFRERVPAHESRSSTLTFWDQAAPLPAGRYHLSVIYPPDVLAAPLEADFEVPAATQPATRP